MIKDNLKQKILEKSISLKEIGLHDLAWKKEDAKILINSLINDDIGILGGDVYRIEADKFIPLSDSWWFEPIDGEEKEDFFTRSKLKSIDYIDKYPSNPEEGIIFSLVFTENIN